MAASEIMVGELLGFIAAHCWWGGINWI